MQNRLAQASSPYLRQHADNPVPWQPWDEASLAQAKRENKPIFVSVGYSTCHWCHVMAHESFEDPEVGQALGKSFVCIKLDREERPDLDEALMTAVQVATGHGGWPISIFLTPDLKPYFAGTYFPRRQRGEVPGFLTIISSLAQAWEEDQEKVQQAADEFAQHLSGVLGAQLAPATSLPSTDDLDHAVDVLAEGFDGENGGFSTAPKFPPHSALRYLMAYAQNRAALPGPPADERIVAAGTMALMTLEKMALGGIHDHAAGGFHRYSTDRHWLLPHFEKMLYDNGQLLYSYSIAAREALDDEQAGHLQSAADGIVAWLKREMLLPGGFFASAQDADSLIEPGGHSEEGYFATWTQAEIESLLGERASSFIEAYGIRPEGNFAEEATGRLTGRNILFRTTPGTDKESLEVLLEARQKRPAPARDDKALLSANSLMISGLVAYGDLESAKTCADAWLNLWTEKGLPHQVVNGTPEGTAFLDDLAFFAEALLDLAEATEEDKWGEAAEKIVEWIDSNFADPRGGCWFTPHGSEFLYGRTMPWLDKAEPSANGVLLRVRFRLGLWEESLPHLAAGLPWARRMPQATETVHEAMIAWLSAMDDQSATMTEAPQLINPDEIRVTLLPKAVKAAPGEWAAYMLTISLPKGVHINSTDPSVAWLHATKLRLEGILGEAGFPEAENDRYEGDVQIPVRVRAPQATKEFQLVVSYQACTETECLAPVERSLTARVLIEP